MRQEGGSLVPGDSDEKGTPAGRWRQQAAYFGQLDYLAHARRLDGKASPGPVLT